MTTPPPRRQQLTFWLLSRRVDLEHRPWVAAQVTDPGFNRRRVRVYVVVQLVLVVLPQLLLSLRAEGRWHLYLATAAAGITGVVALIMARRGLPDWQRRWLLAYHGVTGDGRLVPPQSMLASNPLGNAGTALLMAQVLLFASGVAAAFHLSSSGMQCRPAPAAAVAAVQAAVGVAGQTGFPAQSAPTQFAGATLAHAQRLDSGLDGVYYVAAFVRGPSTPAGFNGVGPAVWRVIEPGGVFPVTEIQVGAADLIARDVTPALGYSYNSPPDRRLVRVQECVLDQV